MSGMLDRIRDKISNDRKKPAHEISGFDPEKHTPVIRCSICTGEQTAGYRDKATGRFTEVMLIRTDDDLDEFRRMVHTDEIRREY